MNTSLLKFTISPTESLNKAWQAVTSNIGVMAGFTILFYLVSTIAGRIPLIGGLKSLFDFVLSVSLFSAFNSIDRSGKASFNDLFNWTPKFARLLVAYLVIIVIAVIVLTPAMIYIFIVLGSQFFSSWAGSGLHLAGFGGFSISALIGLAAIAFLGLILLAIFSFALLFLMLFRDLSLSESLKLSISVGRDNIGGIIVYALLSLGIVILGAMALLIGLLIAIPVIVGMQYYLLRSIFPIEETGKWDFMHSEEAP